MYIYIYTILSEQFQNIIEICRNRDKLIPITHTYTRPLSLLAWYRHFIEDKMKT